jgi:hypothetical protein
VAGGAISAQQSVSRLHEAISKAIEQTKRAAEVVAKLRSIASP